MVTPTQADAWVDESSELTRLVAALKTTSIAAIESGAPAPVLTAALFARFSSRGEDEFANRLLSAMRRQFGGHAEKSR